MSMNSIFKGSLLSIIIISFMLISGCFPEESTKKQQAEARDEIAETANKVVPPPEITHFRNRSAIKEYMLRMDDPNKTFYVYIMSYTGEVVGYYVTKTHPVSVCELMTPPKDWYENEFDADQLGPAPTLNGTYSSGADCSHYYALTAGSDTLIEFSMDFIIQDRPLQLESDVNKFGKKNN